MHAPPLFSSPVQTDMSLELRDILGRLVLSAKVAAGSKEQSIMLADIDNGTYLYSVKIEKETSFTGKIIKLMK